MQAVASAIDSCTVAAWGVIRAFQDEVPSLRKSLAERLDGGAIPQLVKYAADDSILALAAVDRALAAFPALREGVEEWAVLVAPRFFARLGAIATIGRYAIHGPRGTSPLMIPTQSLHAPSATISLAFGMRGPNYGVGGGPENIAEGLLAGLSLQRESRPPGTWVVLTAWDDEPLPERDPPAVGRAVALALVDHVDDRMSLRLVGAKPKEEGVARLASLSDFLASLEGPRGTWSCPLEWGGELQLSGGVEP